MKICEFCKAFYRDGKLGACEMPKARLRLDSPENQLVGPPWIKAAIEGWCDPSEKKDWFEALECLSDEEEECVADKQQMAIEGILSRATTEATSNEQHTALLNIPMALTEKALWPNESFSRDFYERYLRTDFLLVEKMLSGGDWKGAERLISDEGQGDL